MDIPLVTIDGVTYSFSVGGFIACVIIVATLFLIAAAWKELLKLVLIGLVAVPLLYGVIMGIANGALNTLSRATHTYPASYR